MSTKAEMLACVAREIRFRERVYPRLIERGRMTKPKAKLELRIMRDIRTTIERHVPDDVLMPTKSR